MIFFAFYLLAAILIYFSFRSFRGGIDYLNYFKKELEKPVSEFTPFATIIAPCRGLDQGLKENLTALMTQDYPDYEVIFVVDDAADPAIKIIEKISALYPERSNLVIASRSGETGQKVENLRQAVVHMNAISKVLVFVDSDARPGSAWLRHLIAPLKDENIGAATGYRWFISKKPDLSSEMRSAWNASIASALGANTTSNFCWGGSMAVRRGVFEKLEIREKWRGTLSDDFTLTRAVTAASLGIYFVPGALTASIENSTLRELLEFTNRQMKITRVYAPHLWKLSFLGSVLFICTMVCSLVIFIFSRDNRVGVVAALTTILLVSFFSIGKAWLRLKAVRLVLCEYDQDIRRQYISQNTLWLLVPGLFLFNCLVAAFSRRINWRGTLYEMVSARETRVIRG